MRWSWLRGSLSSQDKNSWDKTKHLWTLIALRWDCLLKWKGIFLLSMTDSVMGLARTQGLLWLERRWLPGRYQVLYLSNMIRHMMSQNYFNSNSMEPMRTSLQSRWWWIIIMHHQGHQGVQRQLRSRQDRRCRRETQPSIFQLHRLKLMTQVWCHTFEVSWVNLNL